MNNSGRFFFVVALVVVVVVVAAAVVDVVVAAVDVNFAPVFNAVVIAAVIAMRGLHLERQRFQKFFTLKPIDNQMQYLTVFEHSFHKVPYNCQTCTISISLWGLRQLLSILIIGLEENNNKFLVL